MSNLAAVAAAAMMTLAAAPAMAQTDKQTSIVLVHGAFVDASGWKSVYDLLTKDGYEVLVVQNPTVTLEGDAAATEQVIAAAKHPVVLVGHSYGGAVVTQAGANPKVRSVVYIAAFAPDIGETVLQLASAETPGEPHAPLLPPNNGFLMVETAKFPDAFAAGVDPSLTRFMAASQVPWGLGAVGAKLTQAAWKDRPTYFMVTTKDHMVPPSSQRMMAKRANATVTEIVSPHAVMLAHPREVAAFIEKAAQAVK